MYYDVVSVRHIKDYKLALEFENGEKGIVDLNQYTKKGGLFTRFTDIDYFKKVKINKELGVLYWPGGLDIAPETIYAKATGKKSPNWSIPDKKTSRALKKTGA